MRRRSSSLTPPRSGRGSRRDRSPGSDHIRGSPRPPPPDDRFESVKRHGGKRMVYSRTPSPKDKFKDMGVYNMHSMFPTIVFRIFETQVHLQLRTDMYSGNSCGLYYLHYHSSLASSEK